MKLTVNVNVTYVPGKADGFTTTKEHFVVKSHPAVISNDKLTTAPIFTAAAETLDGALRDLQKSIAEKATTPEDEVRYWDIDIGRILNVADLPDGIRNRLVDEDYVDAKRHNRDLDAATLKAAKDAAFRQALVDNAIHPDARVSLDYDDRVLVCGVYEYDSWSRRNVQAIKDKRFPRRKDGEFNWTKIKEHADYVGKRIREKKDAEKAKAAAEKKSEAIRESLNLSKYNDRVSVLPGGKQLRLTVAFDTEKLDAVVKALATAGVEIK